MAELKEEKVSADIPGALHKELKERCEIEGRSIKWYIIRGLEMALGKRKSLLD